MKLKLTPERQQKIITLLRSGNSRDCAMLAAGVSRTSFYRWMARGREAKSGVYRDFWDSIEKAESEAEAFHVANIAMAAKQGTWQASAWWLERVRSERYGKKQSIAHSKAPTRLSNEEAQALQETSAITAADGGAVWKRQLLLLEKAYQAGDLDSRFYFQMLAQLTAGATRLAELGLRGDGPAMPNIQIEFNMSDASIGRPNSQPVQIARTEHCGDLIEVS